MALTTTGTLSMQIGACSASPERYSLPHSLLGKRSSIILAFSAIVCAVARPFSGPVSRSLTLVHYWKPVLGWPLRKIALQALLSPTF
jgi:hypothetical protein